MSDHAPLKVLIVGAGIGGLSTAIGLRQQGHKVEIFEKSQLAREIGAGIFLSPNCTTLLNRLGVDLEPVGGTPLRRTVTLNSKGEIVRQKIFDDEDRKRPEGWFYLIHRVHLHNELRRLATSDDGSIRGHAAQPHTGCAVDHIDSESGIITLADGSKVTGDVVIAADGIHSQLRNPISGGSYKTSSTGKSCYRCILPVTVIKEDPATASLAEYPGQITEIMGYDRRITLYPCANDQQMYVAAFVPTEEVGHVQEGWDRTGNKRKLLQSFSGFGPTIQRLLQKVPEADVRMWDLLDCPTIETWIRGRAALLGDAAHPFLPYLGQGGAMAIEDAASITALLAPGTTAAEVPGRLELYQRCRKERVDYVQHITRLRGRDASGKQGPPVTGAQMEEFVQYCVNHDERDHTNAILDDVRRKTK